MLRMNLIIVHSSLSGYYSFMLKARDYNGSFDWWNPVTSFSSFIQVQVLYPGLEVSQGTQSVRWEYVFGWDLSP